jgi:hypothetical protein
MFISIFFFLSGRLFLDTTLYEYIISFLTTILAATAINNRLHFWRCGDLLVYRGVEHRRRGTGLSLVQHPGIAPITAPRYTSTVAQEDYIDRSDASVKR